MEVPLYSQPLERKVPDATDEALTRCSTMVPDCFDRKNNYVLNQDPSMVDRTGCRSSLNDCMADTETVDTVVDSCSFPEHDFPTDHFDMYVNTDVSGRCFTPDGGLRVVKTSRNEPRTEIVRPVIRLKSASEMATPQSEDFRRYASQLSVPPIPDVVDSSYLRQNRVIDFTNNLEDFMRSSSQLCRPVGKSAPQTTPDVIRMKMPGSGGHDVPINTPTAVFAGEERYNHPTTVSTRTPYLYGHDVPTCESELFFTPTLPNRGSDVCNNYIASSNYCVYVGSDSNAISCGCNVLRPCGGNCHVSGCHVVTSELEPSTEQWPVSGSSYLQSLVKQLDRVVEGYKGTSPINGQATTFQQVPSKGWQRATRVPHMVSQEKLVSRIPEYGKWSAPIQSEYSSHREEANCPDYYVQTSYEDSPYDCNMISNKHENHLKQRKTNRGTRTDCKNDVEAPSRNEYGRFVPARTTSPASSPENQPKYTIPKSNKKSANPAVSNNGEKVSGVWYDTNRHLWRVVYMKGNKRKTQGFSSVKLGYEEARRKAIEMRHEMVVLRRADKV